MFVAKGWMVVAGGVITAACGAAVVSAADVIKANNTNNLNLGTSWTSGTAPTPADVAVWNNTVTASNTSALGGDVSWQGIKVQAPGGRVAITGAANTLTLGGEGIALLSGSQQLEIQSRVTLLTSQTWTLNTTPSATQSLVFNAQAAATAFTMGGNALDVVGTGTVRFTSGSLLTGGTINVGNTMFDVQSGASRTSAIGSDVTINVSSGKLLRFGINSAPGSGIAVSSSAAVVLNSGTVLIESSGAPGTNRLIQSGLLTMNVGAGISNSSAFGYGTQFTGGIAATGSVNWLETNSGTAHTQFSGPLTGSGTLNVRNQATARRVEWSGDNAAFAGTVAINGASGNRNLRLTSGSAGSSLATWTIASGNTLEVDGVSVSLGALTGAGTLTNSHATAAAIAAVGSGTFTGLITNGTGSGGMGLTKVGSGLLSLGGANTYTGPTTVTAGTLAVTSAYAGTSGSFSAVTLADNATLVVTQATPTATYNVSSFVLGGSVGSAVQVALASGATTAPITTAGLTLNGTSTLQLNVAPVVGMKLIAHASPLIGDLSQLQLVGLPFRVSATLVDTGSTSIDIGTVLNNAPKWRGDIDSVWNIDTTGGGGSGTPNWVETDSGLTTRYIQASSGTDAVTFDDSATGSTAITLNEAVLPVGVTFSNVTKDYSISGTGGIGGPVGITKTGAGALTLATANTFTGGVSLGAGQLNIANAGSLGSGKLTIAGGSLDNTSGAALTTTSAIPQDWNADFTFVGSHDLTFGNGAVTLGGDRTVTVTASQLSVGGVAGVGRSLTKAGAGTLVIGASTYTGTTTVAAGTLRAGSASSFTSTAGVVLANAAGATLDLNGFSQTITNLSGGGATGGNVVLGGATLTTGAAADATIGSLSGAGGLVKAGAGRMSILGGAAGFTGTTSITGGTLDVGPLAGVFGSGTISITGANFIQASGTLTQSVVGNAAGISARGGDLVVNVGGSGALVNMNSAGNGGIGQFVFGSPSADSRVIVQNQIGINNFGGTRTITVNAGAGGASAELAGVISPGAAGGESGIIKAGSGRLILSAANTYTGPTTVNAGVLAVTNPLALQFSTINTAGAGTYDLTGVSTPTIGGLSGSTALASVVSAGYAGVTSLTINRISGTATYAGGIAEGAGGMSVTKAGAGTQVLSGSSTYTGGTLISGGRLVLDATGAIDGTAFVSLGTSGTFDVSAKVGGYSVPVLVGEGSVVGSLTVRDELAIGSSPGTITVSGGLALSGSSTSIFEVQSGSSAADLANVGGLLSIGTGAALDLRQTGTFTAGEKFTLFGYQTLAGGFAGLPDLSYVIDDLGNSWQINYADTSPGLNGGTGTAFVTVRAVPEPATLGVAAVAALAVLVSRRRRHGRTTSAGR
jgi:fibronectin-binding autotransporter adhesin